MAHRLFQSLFDVVFAGNVTATIGTGGAGSGTTSSTTVTVQGVKVGDEVLVFTYGAGGALTAGAPIVGNVSAANTVRLAVLNNTAGALTTPYNAATVYQIIVLRFMGK